MNEFETLQVKLHKLDIQFSKWDDYAFYVFDPRNKEEKVTNYIMVVYNPLKDAIAWMKVINGVHGIGIADDLQEILVILVSFYFEGDEK